MATRRESIIAALVASLQAGPSIGAPVYRSRVVPLARNEAPAIIVEPVADQANQAVVPMLDWTLLIRVALIVRGSVPDQVADPIVEAIHARVMSDLTVGGLAYDVQPQSVDWQIEDADSPAGIITMTFAVLYRTGLTDVSGV